MENASKALIIAGGMLIGMIIASLFAYEMSYVANNAKEYYEKEYMTQITEFNTQFENYANKEAITAQEVVTLYNYIQEWNIDNDSTYIEFDGNKVTELKKVISNYNSYTTEDFLVECYNKSYTCKLEYGDSEILGRVNKVIIEEKK